MFEFGLEKGSKKFICPQCGQKKFVRHISSRTGEYLSSDVGRCDRESGCGYHKKPKEFFAETPNLSDFKKAGVRKKKRINYGFVEKTAVQSKLPDYIEQDYLLRTLTNYELNSFVQFLLELFPENTDLVWQAVKDYLLGTSKDGKTIFWQIDGRRNIRTGKLIAYNSETGKRRKDISPDWIHAALKRAGKLKCFNLKQCFFGEHLLTDRKPLAIVEAEKTAVIASICFPEFVWLAAGGKSYLKAEKLNRFGSRKIVLYPDGDGFERWQEIALKARSLGLAVEVSALIETQAKDEQKANGYDLADFLINEQQRITEHNLFADTYNAKVDFILNDDEFFAAFNNILDEQKAVLVIDGKLSEREADARINHPDNIRSIVLSL